MQEERIDIILIIIGISSFFLVITFFFILFFHTHLKNYKKYFQEKQTLKIQFDKDLLQTQIEIQEQTLKTISQEIHDNVGQILSLAKLNLGTFDEMESDYNQTKIDDTKILVGKAINDLRELSRSLSGDKMADLGLTDAVENELKIISNTGQFETSLTISGDPFKLSPQNEMVIFRIVQESLNNVLKHSKADNIRVNINYEVEYFKLSVSDDGAGFDADLLEAKKTGIGLNNMKSRATLIGARFSINSKPWEGTTVLVELYNKPV
ncbi:MAG: sensor histidine kinase [Ferruginibacter sp.]|nr:sensor histidine kinase [Ferruginibacter sp.]